MLHLPSPDILRDRQPPVRSSISPIFTRLCPCVKVEIKNFEEEQSVEERQRVAVIRDLHQRAEMQRASDHAWAKKVEEAQAMADGLVKKARTNELLINMSTRK